MLRFILILTIIFVFGCSNLSYQDEEVYYPSPSYAKKKKKSKKKASSKLAEGNQRLTQDLEFLAQEAIQQRHIIATLNEWLDNKNGSKMKETKLEQWDDYQDEMKETVSDKRDEVKKKAKKKGTYDKKLLDRTLKKYNEVIKRYDTIKKKIDKLTSIPPHSKIA